MRTLRNNYLKGLLLYPRVENSYIKDSCFAYFPHPKLNILNSYYEPLKKDYYSLDSNSFLLHLHNKRYFNVSNTESIQKLIKARITKKNKLNLNIKDYELIANYKKFLEYKKEEDLDYFLKEQLTHYKQKKPKMLKIDYSKSNLLEHIEDLKNKLEKEVETYSQNIAI